MYCMLSISNGLRTLSGLLLGDFFGLCCCRRCDVGGENWKIVIVDDRRVLLMMVQCGGLER